MERTIANKYELTQHIGSDSKQNYYLARTILGDSVLLSEFRLDGYESAEAMDTPAYQAALSAFIKDIHHISAFSAGEHIIHMQESFQESNSFYTVSEAFYDGVPLAQYTQTYGRMNEKQAVSLFVPLIRAVDLASKANVQHKSIHTHNLYMIKGRLTLLSFGEYGRSAQHIIINQLAQALYYAVTGLYQPEARLAPIQAGASVSPGFEAVLYKALQISEETNYRTIFEFCEALSSLPQDRYYTAPGATAYGGPYPNQQPPRQHGMPSDPSPSPPPAYAQPSYSNGPYPYGKPPAPKSGNGSVVAAAVIIGLLVFAGLGALFVVIYQLSNNSAALVGGRPEPTASSSRAQRPRPADSNRRSNESGQDRFTFTESPEPEPTPSETEDYSFFDSDYDDYAGSQYAYGDIEPIPALSFRNQAEIDGYAEDGYFSEDNFMTVYDTFAYRDYSNEEIISNGLVAEADGWRYYRKYDMGQWSFYREKLDGSLQTLLRNDCAPSFILVKGTFLYYVDSLRNYQLFHMGIDGGNAKVIVPYQVVYPTWGSNKTAIYFSMPQYGGMIFRYDLGDGLFDLTCYDDTGEIYAQGDWIYFIDYYDYNYLSRIQQNADYEVVVDKPMFNPVPVGNSIYYASIDDYKVYRYDLDTSVSHLVLSRSIYQMTVHDGWLYYIDDENNYNLYRYPLDGSADPELLATDLSYFQITGDHIYYVSDDLGSVLIQSNLEGGQLRYMDE